MLEFGPFLLTFQMALITTILLLVISVPLAFWLWSSQFRLKFLFEALVSLPLILPPSVIGFYLLLAFSPGNEFGKFLERFFDLRLVFTFEGLIVSSILYSLPFMVQPVLTGFRMLPPSFAEVSYTLGKSKLTTLFRVLLPNMKAALITGCILTFAHTVGEFGVVLMVGGNIPDETRVVSVAIYDAVEAMDYHSANSYAVILLVFAFLLLLCVYFVNNRLFKVPAHD
jgi:molybdate transport system permease protein